jgi:hypothetical protein
MHLVTESCASLKLFKQNFCIKTIFVQSIDDIVSWDINDNLRYMDLSSADKKMTPVLWNLENADIKKDNAIKITKDASQYHV